MDPVSQGVVGAICAQTFAGEKNVRWATVAGVAGGMAADLDILIRSADDPLLTLEYHRHFTHAAAFIPVGGLLVASILWIAVRARASMGFARWASFCTLGYATAGVLDACTSYGTRLWWPFSDARVAWDLISIIDPVFTVPLLYLAGRAVRRRSPAAGRIAVIWALLYLGLGYAQRERAEGVALELAASRGHEVVRLVVKPSFGNLIVWRSTYSNAEHVVFVDALHMGFDIRVYRGDRIRLVRPATDFAHLPEGCRLRRDIDRFTRFSAGWLGWTPGEKNVLGDLRYASLPDEVKPLWGIELASRRPEERVKFRTFRRADAATWRALWSMIRGVDRQ